MTTKLFGYARVSTRDQEEEGVSLEAQSERIAQYCRAIGYDCIEVVQDAAVSGSIPPSVRPGFGRILKHLAKKKGRTADGVVACKLDRFSRSTRDALDLVSLAEREDWRLVSVAETLDTKSASGRLVVTILSAFAEFERSVIGERTREGMAQLKREGRQRSRYAPFGFQFATDPEDPKRNIVTPNPTEQTVIAKVMSMHRDGFSLGVIAEQVTNPRTGRPLHRQSVQRMIKSC